MTRKVPVPSKESIHKYLALLETLERYALAEGALGLLFNELCPKNANIENVLLKVSALNDFYSTNIYDSFVGKMFKYSRKWFEEAYDGRVAQ